MFYVGIVFVIALIAIVGVMTGKVKNSQYDNSRRASSKLVAGALIGTLVGGSSTIGTAQLAFNYGFSAWWFTLGGGIGVLLLGCVFAKPMYTCGGNTIADMLEREYGSKSGLVCAILSSIGTFLSFVAQIISGAALVMAVTNIQYTYSLIIVAVLMIIYVFWGGTLALGYGGIVKTVVLSLSVAICGVLSVVHLGGIDLLHKTDVLPHAQYFNLFARGFAIDAGAGMSLLIGVITTQSYISAILMAKSLDEAKKGTYITAVIVPLIGIAGIFVGMYMRVNYPDIDAKMALPMFIMEKMPPLVAGMMLAALLVAVTGTGAGLSFGMASMIYRNIFVKLKPGASEKQSKTIIRLFLLSIVILGGLLCYLNLSGLILSWSFLSMGLRGAVAFFPLIGALFLKGRIDRRFVIPSMFFGVGLTFVGKLIMPDGIDPLFLGLFASLIVMVSGTVVMRRTKNQATL